MLFRKKKGSLIIISAPSGSGKTSLISELTKKHDNIISSISHTTRPKRLNEVNGEHYHFVSESFFKQAIQKNEFIEYAKVFDHYYGTHTQSINTLLEQNKIVILEIDWQGAQLIRKIYPTICSIFILPPSLPTLKKRLISRNQDSTEVINKRVELAKTDINHYSEYQFVLINDIFNKTLSDLESILFSELLKTTNFELIPSKTSTNNFIT